MAYGQEAEYNRSPMAREPLITGKTIKEDKERKAKEALVEQEREKEQARQKERNKSYERIQADRESAANIFDSYSTTNSPATTPETNSNKDSQNNYTESSSQEIDLTNSSQSWGGLFGAVVGAWSGANNKNPESQRERKQGGNFENPNRNRENSNKSEKVDQKSPHLDENFLTYLADRTDDNDYRNFEKCRKNPAWFKTSEIREIIAYYRNKIN